MLNNEIKAATKAAHQQLEKAVVLRLKNIRSDVDYAEFLKHFYAYFYVVEQAIAPFITAEVLPDYAERRNSAYLRRDIEALGSNLSELPAAVAPTVNTTVEALGAMYVLEGSIMGGPYIVQLLQKQGIAKGFSFFSGYGETMGRMWGGFTAVLNTAAVSPEQREAAISKASETFSKFGDVFLGTVNEVPAN